MGCVTYEAYAERLGFFRRVGGAILGLEAPIVITEAGIIAACHRAGVGTVAGYFKKLDASGGDSKVADLTLEERWVESRLRNFQSVPYQRFNPPRGQR